MIYPKIPVLLYHSIEKDYFKIVLVLDFEKQMSYLKNKKYISIYTNEINKNKKSNYFNF